MNSRSIAARGTALVVLIGSVLMAGSIQAVVTMDQYSSVPPFVSDQVAPNILLVLDNSGSMADNSCDSTWCGVHSDGTTTPVTQSFVATTIYSGFFDTLSCYTYDSTNTRFDASTTKAAVSTACGGTTWDGNFLNWATFRRFDALKKAMSGGDCIVTRNADGTCPASGSPAKITVTAQTVFSGSGSGHHTTAATSSSTYGGRVPTAATSGTPANIYIHLRGGTAGMGGTFCVDDDNSAPSSSATSCTDADAFAESQYKLRLSQSSEPTGVVQQIGSQARFGLFEFKGSGDGARMLVGLGLRQSINFADSTVETFNTNSAAILDAIGESYPSTWTPLSESLYESARYIAQINSTYLTTAYVYPIAYAGGNSNGVAFQATGVGSIGAPEITALTGSETCPSGYITNACGRDPYFFGSNHTPAWASTSTQVSCCKTYVIIVTDGEPTQDTNIPSALQDYAHGQHGLHCTGGSTTIHTPNGTCNTNSATPTVDLLGEHKTDYASSGNHYLDDVAYWMHINDLRPCNGSADGTIAILNVTGHCLGGLQNATVYTFFAFGNIAGRELLMHTAKLGGFEDSNGNSIPDLTSEWDKVINATGAAGSDGIPDTYFESSNVDDLQDRLLATITSIIRKSASGTSISVLATSSTGEGSIYQAYFYTSDVGQNGANVKWTGYTHALFIDQYGNFREDTDQDGKLNYVADYIVATRYDNNSNSPTFGQVLVDKYVDANGDGKADSTTPTVLGANLKSIVPIWEAGSILANTASTARNLITWVDSNNDGIVDAGEQMAFSTANSAALTPYLTAVSAPTTGDNIINFVRGDEISGLRTRMIETPVGSGTYKVWKLGDPIHSTPTVIGAPRDRYDVIYGDATYATFYQQYRTRRQVAYTGANDGMLHAFNAGYYHKGDDPTTSSVIEHGWFTKSPTDNSSGKALGAELWGFIPYQLLPQLQWLTRSDYTHVYYVDLKPKVTDVRIFTPDADHPGGWGTILIGGFRMGGSCGQCDASTGATALSGYTIGGQVRNFYSAYFVLDITNPEVDPKLLWVFSDAKLGLTTSYPAVLRVSPSGDAKTDNTNAKWYALFGSGPNGYQALLPSLPAQTATIYAVNLAAGPGSANSLVTSLPAGSWNSFLADMITMDKDLDYRVDAAYFGRTINDGTNPQRGKLYRLTTGGCASAPCAPTTWGIASGSKRIPTEIIDTFTCTHAAGSPTACTGGSKMTGPITAAPTVTTDDTSNVWVFFGTGRYLNNSDKTDTRTQYLFGLKDFAMNGGCTQTSSTNCHSSDLVNVTNAVVCLVCGGGTNQVTDPNNASVTSFNGTSGTTSMIGLIKSKDGWYNVLPVAAGSAAERSVVNPTIIGGTVFFPTFVPTNDFCAATGTSSLYALFYLTGTAFTEPVIGTSASGSNTVINTKIDLGQGIASSMSIQIGSQGSGGLGGGGGGGNCAGGVVGAIQMSTGAAVQPCVKPALPSWSRYVSWAH